MVNNCKTCRYWQLVDNNGEEQIGKCRRHAPRAALVPDGNWTRTLWPLTNEHDWCGDYSRHE